MIKANVRRGDGLSSGRVWLNSVVRTVQMGLNEAGFGIKADGKFGATSASIAKAYQRTHGLDVTGEVKVDTWKQLQPLIDKATQAELREVREYLKKFEGDLYWVHAQEGHNGRPYWPGGESGVTLDPGVDLGHAHPEMIGPLYKDYLSKTELNLLSRVYGLKGSHARDALKNLPALKKISISEPVALAIMPHSARHYWNGIVRRFPVLSNKTTPPSVQTVLLSLAYNRGVFNRHLEVLKKPLTQKDWTAVADTVRGMQQSHKLSGIRLRRRNEGELIFSELEFSSKPGAARVMSRRLLNRIRRR